MKRPIPPSCSCTSGKFAACVLQACVSDSTADTTCQPASRAPSQNPPAPQKSEIALSSRGRAPSLARWPLRRHFSPSAPTSFFLPGLPLYCTLATTDRKGRVLGKGGSGRVDLGWRRILKKKTQQLTITKY